MASANWMKATTQKAGAMKKHLGQKEREEGNHSNTDIDQSLSKNNYALGCADYGEALERMKRRTKEVDELIPPKRIRKDRVTCCFIELPCPLTLTERGLSNDFFKEAYKTLSDFFGAENVHGGFVHKDEVHTYTDKDKAVRTSLEHVHVLVSAYTPEKGINGKAFETRARLKSLNTELDEMCFRSFGVRLNTKETPEHKSVERLKEETELRKEADTLHHRVTELEQQADNARDRFLEYDEKAKEAETRQAEAEQRADGAEKRLTEAEHKLDIANKKHDVAAKELEKVLDQKARASEIHKISHIFGETVEYHKNMLESTRAIGSEAYKELSEANKTRQEAVELLENTHKRASMVEPMYKKAQATLQEAERYKAKYEDMVNNLSKRVEERADELAEQKVKAMFGNVPRGKAQRLEEYCDNIQLKDGRTLLEAFEDKERELLQRGRSRGRER